jgi:hypothetical protein
MSKPQKFFRIKIAEVTHATYDIKITITEAVQIAEDEWSEEMIGQQMYRADEAGTAVGVLMESILEDYLDYDPVYMVYRDRSGELPEAHENPNLSNVWKGRFSLQS